MNYAKIYGAFLWIFTVSMVCQAQTKRYEEIDLLIQNQDNDEAIKELKVFLVQKKSGFAYLELAKLYELKAKELVYANPEAYLLYTDSAIAFYDLANSNLTKANQKKFAGYFARELQQKKPSFQICKDYIAQRHAALEKEKKAQSQAFDLANKIKSLYLSQADLFNELLKTNTQLPNFIFSFEDSQRLVLEELASTAGQIEAAIALYKKQVNAPNDQHFSLILVEKLELLKNPALEFNSKNVYLLDFGSWAKYVKELLSKIYSWKLDLRSCIKRFDDLTDSLEVGRMLQTSATDEIYDRLVYDFQMVESNSPVVLYLNYRRDKIELLAYHNDFYSLAIDPRTEESYRNRLMDILSSQNNLAMSRLDSLKLFSDKMLSYELLFENIFGSISRFYEIVEQDFMALQHRASNFYHSENQTIQKGFYRRETFEQSGLIFFDSDSMVREGFYRVSHAAQSNEKGNFIAGVFLNPETQTDDVFVCSLENLLDTTHGNTAKVYWIRKFSFYLDRKPTEDKILSISVNKEGMIALSLFAKFSENYESRLIILDKNGQIVLNQEVSNNGIIKEIRPIGSKDFALLVGGSNIKTDKDVLEKYRYLKINLKGEIIFQNVFSIKGKVCGFYTHGDGAYIFINFLDFNDNKYSRLFGLKPYYRSLLLDLDQGGYIRKSQLLFEGKPSYIFNIENLSQNHFNAVMTHEVTTSEPTRSSVFKFKKELVF
jgi:hypothetical protein